MLFSSALHLGWASRQRDDDLLFPGCLSGPYCVCGSGQSQYRYGGLAGGGCCVSGRLGARANVAKGGAAAVGSVTAATLAASALRRQLWSLSLRRRGIWGRFWELRPHEGWGDVQKRGGENEDAAYWTRSSMNNLNIEKYILCGCSQEHCSCA